MRGVSGKHSRLLCTFALSSIFLRIALQCLPSDSFDVFCMSIHRCPVSCCFFAIIVFESGCERFRRMCRKILGKFGRQIVSEILFSQEAKNNADPVNPCTPTFAHSPKSLVLFSSNCMQRYVATISVSLCTCSLHCRRSSNMEFNRHVLEASRSVRFFVWAKQKRGNIYSIPRKWKSLRVKIIREISNWMFKYLMN